MALGADEAAQGIADVCDGRSLRDHTYLVRAVERWERGEPTRDQVAAFEPGAGDQRASARQEVQ